jgi:glycosyltransferase involved in cell wall biosynthesis
MTTDAAFAAPPARGPLEPGRRPSFSVIVAAWQAADQIGTALESALAQTEPPLEIIVADDGSTDDLAGALARFGDRVCLIRLPHGGAASASNAAAARACGDFVVVLDADDRWDAERLRRLGDLASARPDLDLLTTDAWFVVDGERRGSFYQYNRFETQDQPTEILRRTFFFAHVAVRRTSWAAVGGFTSDLARGYDWDLQLRLLLRGSLAGCVLEPLADYTVHSESLSANRFESFMARVDLLTRAETTQQLSGQQRRVLDEARRRYRHRALAARAEQLLVAGGPGRRRAVLALAAQAGAGVRPRLRALAAAALPERAGRHLRREMQGRGQARSDRTLQD